MSDVEFKSLSPYLRYPDGDEAVAWLTRVFGFGPARKVAGADGAWEEGEVDAGPVRISICGKHDPAPDRGIGGLLILTVDDVDAMHARISAAGVDVDPPVDEAYGVRQCHVTDPWGHHWYFWQGEPRFD